ncbi:MAG: hypothetical protein JRJ59_02055 [Deltaproteobacteria bacterium]|nr:hypothetical protein [Deltaproteobacteria bacterium]
MRVEDFIRAETPGGSFFCGSRLASSGRPLFIDLAPCPKLNQDREMN